MEEQMEFVPSTIPIFIAPMLASLFEIIETSPIVRVEVSDQPIEVRPDAKLKAKDGD